MGQINLEDYKKIIQETYDDQYGENIAPYEEGSYAEKKDVQHFQEIADREFDLSNTSIDVTNIKKDQLKHYIDKYKYFTVGNFSVRINSLTNGKFSIGRFLSRANVIIYEHINDKRIREDYVTLYRVQPQKDDRFIDCDWIKKFDSNGGNCIDTKTMIEILKRLQRIQKFTVFI